MLFGNPDLPSCQFIDILGGTYRVIISLFLSYFDRAEELTSFFRLCFALLRFFTSFKSLCQLHLS